MKYIPLPRSEKSRYYSGQFFDLDLADGRFQLPEQLLRTFRNRNPGIPVEFYAYPINDKEEGVKYVSLYDSVFVESDKSGRFNGKDEYIMIPDSGNLVIIGPSHIQHLGLTDKVSVDGYGQVVRLWNPREFEKHSPRDGVELKDDLDEYMRECYGYRGQSNP